MIRFICNFISVSIILFSILFGIHLVTCFIHWVPIFPLPHPGMDQNVFMRIILFTITFGSILMSIDQTTLGKK